MWKKPTGHQLDQMPRLYETEHIAAEDKLICLHFFLGGCEWYIAEFDGDDLFFGFVILNSDYKTAEWGYIIFPNSRLSPLIVWESAAIWTGLRSKPAKSVSSSFLAF